MINAHACIKAIKQACSFILAISNGNRFLFDRYSFLTLSQTISFFIRSHKGVDCLLRGSSKKKEEKKGRVLYVETRSRTISTPAENPKENESR